MSPSVVLALFAVARLTYVAVARGRDGWPARRVVPVAAVAGPPLAGVADALVDA
jgi:hypothetical protein